MTDGQIITDIIAVAVDVDVTVLFTLSDRMDVGATSWRKITPPIRNVGSFINVADAMKSVLITFDVTLYTYTTNFVGFTKTKYSVAKIAIQILNYLNK